MLPPKPFLVGIVVGDALLLVACGGFLLAQRLMPSARSVARVELRRRKNDMSRVRGGGHANLALCAQSGS